MGCAARTRNVIDAPRPDLQLIAKVILALAGERQGYVLDVGVLAGTGSTVLVEVNDGFAMGAYGSIAPAMFFDVVAARWAQLASIAVR